MPVEVVGTSIVVDLQCIDCSHEWQETHYEDHVENAVNRDFECSRCKLYDTEEEEEEEENDEIAYRRFAEETRQTE